MLRPNDSMKLTIPHANLRTRIIAWSFIPTTIILVIVALVTFYAYQRVTEELVVGRNKELTRLSASQLGSDLTGYADLLNTLARTSDLYSNDSTRQAAALKNASNRLVVFDAGVISLNEFGQVTAAQPERPAALGQDWSNRAYFREIVRSVKPTFSDIVADGPQGVRVIGVAVPILDGQGLFRGTLVGMFRLGATNFSAFYGGIVRDRIDEEATVYIVDSNGRVIYHTDSDLIGSDLHAQPVVQLVLNREADTLRTRDVQGADILASFSPVPGTPWGLVTEQSWAGLLAAGQGYGQFLLLLLALGVIVPAVVVMIGVRRITDPIAKLIAAAQQVAGGNFGQKIEVRTGDELEELVKQFNRMSAQLSESYNALKEREERLALVADISTEFINLGPDKIDDGIQHALQAIGRFAQVDRSYVLLFSDGGSTMDNTHEWCADGIESHLARLQGITTVTFPYFVERIKRFEIVDVPRIADLPPEASAEREEFRLEAIRSLICSPLVHRGAAVGFLGLDSVRVEKIWTEETRTLLTIVGEVLVNALEDKREQEELQVAYQTLERRVEERTHELATLNAIGTMVNRSLDLTEILSDALDKTLESINMEFGAAYRLEGDGDRQDEPLYLTPLVHRGFSEEFIRGSNALPLKGSAIEIASKTGEPLVWQVTDTGTHAGLVEALRGVGIRQVVSIPLIAKGRLNGALYLGTSRRRDFAPEQLALLAAIGQQVGVAVENARLYDQAEQSAQVAERSRLARELHDSVTQSLYSMTLYAEASARLLGAGQPHEAAEHLRELRDTAQEALREMRLLIFELRPSALDKSGLAAALQTRLDAVETRGGMQAELRVEGKEHLSPIVQEELYHIALEALNNALKHSKAHRVQVCLRFEPASTFLEICDDGVGFEPVVARSGGGYGLSGMADRAQKIGGALQIESAPGIGTKVRVLVHVESPENGGGK